MPWREAGFNQFMRRELHGNFENVQGLYDSSLGPSKSLDPGKANDMFPGGILSMEKILAGIIIANQGTIGGWTISDSTLTSGNITIDSENHRIIINDGTTNRVLLGYGAGLF